ncbi:MAG: HlyD family efflux transporter periplasmic adaptor subunit [Bacteroidetes bacterium]|jgi:HlyD family secretion protein|nr:HlyD family efflux transporter periplasmic adaptor subunit [Bacteroidota bacterium]MDF1863906.1 HlyD family efflux transporter periplasmic adaptor subunit [Saprospiraceae bacterium]
MDKKIAKKGLAWQKILLYTAIAAVAGYFITTIYKDAGTSRLNVETDRLLIDTVQNGIFQEFIPVTGVVQPIKTVFIDAVEGGRVEEKFVEDGAMVQKGKSILRLSNPDLQLTYLNQEADIVRQINQLRTNSIMMEQQSLNLKEQYLEAEYRIDLLDSRTKRNKELSEAGALDRVTYEETQDEFEHLLRRKKMLTKTIERDSMFQVLQAEQMESSLDLMKRNLAITRQSLDNLIVKAPIGGQLSGLDTELGELISEGENIAQIDDLSNFKILTRIDEFYISRIFINQKGSFIFAGKTYELIIKKIYPQVSNGAFEVDMVFTGTVPEGIKRGQTVSIKLELSAEQEALLLARGSFYQKTGGNWVYMIEEGTSSARKVNIKVGKQNPNFYEVLEGLKPGDVVITSSYDNFGDKDVLELK